MLLARRNGCSQHVKKTDAQTCAEQQKEWTGTQEGWAGSAQGHREGPQEQASGLRWRSRVCQFLQSAPGSGAQAERGPRRWVRARKRLWRQALSYSMLYSTVTDTETHVSWIVLPNTWSLFSSWRQLSYHEDTLIDQHNLLEHFVYFSRAHRQWQRTVN